MKIFTIIPIFILLSCGYRVKSDINTHIIKGIVNNYTGEQQVMVYYDVWIYKGLKPIEDILIDVSYIDKSKISFEMILIKRRIDSSKEVAKILIREKYRRKN